MEKYMILFDTTGNRLTTYALGVHYQTEDEYQQLLTQNFTPIEEADYQKLIGNYDSKHYVYSNGAVVEYQPTAEELAERVEQNKQADDTALLAAIDEDMSTVDLLELYAQIDERVTKLEAKK